MGFLADKKLAMTVKKRGAKTTPNALTFRPSKSKAYAIPKVKKAKSIKPTPLKFKAPKYT